VLAARLGPRYIDQTTRGQGDGQVAALNPKHSMSAAAAELKGFILRQEVLHLYRQLLRVSKGAQDPASRGGCSACCAQRLWSPWLFFVIVGDAQ